MKYFVTILLSLNLFAGEFTKLTVITPDMPIPLIKSMIEGVENGTVIEFQGGEYNFKNPLVIQSKKDIALRGEKNSEVVLNGLIITFNDVNTLKTLHLTLQNNSAFVLNNTQKFDLGLLNVQNSQIDLYQKSIGIIHDAQMSLDKNASWHSVYMDGNNSTVIDNVTFKNSSEKLASIYSKNNSFEVKSSKLISKFFVSILAVHSKVFLHENTFDGKYYQKYFHRAVDIEEDSQLIANKNVFSNYYVDVWASKSLLKIEDNKFSNSVYSIFLFDNNQGELYKNIFSSNIKAVFFSKSGNTIYIEDSIFIENEVGIDVSDSSEASISNNRFENTRQTSSKVKNIIVRDFAAANIANIKHSQSTYCYAAKHSKIYVYNGYSGVSLEGLGDPQVQDSSIYFYTKEMKFSPSVFEQVKRLSNIPFYLSSQLLKGYLQKPIIIYDEYGNEDKINVGTYIIFDSITNMLVQPKEYFGQKLKEVPNLKIRSSQRKIELLPSMKNINSKKYITFDIKSNIVLEKIVFDNSPLQRKYMTVDGYKSLSRRVKSDGQYGLELQSADFSLFYRCEIKDLNVSCYPKNKLTL